MKIVDHTTFLTLPKGTVFCLYEDYIIGKLCIKNGSITFSSSPIDFNCTSLSGEPVDPFDPNADKDYVECYDLAKETECPICFMEERDGSFDLDQKYLIYSNDDVKAMIELLQKSVT